MEGIQMYKQVRAPYKDCTATRDSPDYRTADQLTEQQRLLVRSAVLQLSGFEMD